MAYAPIHPTPLSIITEVEFLVAVEKEGHSYNATASEIDTQNTSSQRQKWACPSQADDPSIEVLHQCKAVLSRDNNSVIIRHNEAHLTERSWQSARFDSWIVQPSHSSFASSSSPKQYDWSGVKLRSPLIHEPRLKGGDPSSLPVGRCVEALRSAVLIHVNSTCRFSISLRPRGGFTLVQAKKLATLVWLTERDLLVPLRHLSGDAVVVCPRPVTTTSLTAVSRHGQTDVGKTLDPLLEGIMKSHLPTGLKDAVAQGCLQKLWACPDLAHLSRALRDRHHSALAFALYVHDDDEAEDSSTSRCAVASFRCALWHPRLGLDVSPQWTDLVLAFGRAMSLTSEPFRSLVAEMDEINRIGRTGGVETACHRTRLMKALGVDDARCAEWEGILTDCRNGA
ncbi:uncharacterized protein MAM_04554 [Metarhizium album ARSEF 1941]|uniref:Uncharacterized protein n=1 Tax=Metarhizium album (strain ARSEF 1941) TaxID=1081103 RepID=A0A0B2WV74_METAS|nr:uncharacterized protein MAM_04554 [Metarhizium album ARSEF 1941]KHN97539.1 hypothetical protein MAM_04554 [Metarhizium album ARSEF 1941]